MFEHIYVTALVVRQYKCTPPTKNTDMAEQQESISEQNLPLSTEEHPTSISVEGAHHTHPVLL